MSPNRSLRQLSCLAILGAALLLGALTGSAGAAQTAAVQTHLLWSDVTPAEVDRQLDQAKSSGAGMVRVDLGWASLEPTGKGQWSSWYLGRIDDVVTKARARGLQVLFTVWETPCWASRAPESVKAGCTGSWWSRGVQRYGPTDPADYADAVAFLARRYAGRVKAWEIWNEPNSSDYFVSGSPVSEYAGLVKATYAPAKAADPTATIVAGSIMWADAAFVSGLYDNGIKGKFDALSIHPYSDDRSPLSPGSDAWIRGSFVRGVPAVHDAMTARGDDKPLWLTEYGWSTTTTRNSDNWLNGVSEATQASFVTDAVVKMASWSYVDVGVYYELKDTGTDPASTISHFGLTRPDGSEKPAFGAFRDAIARVGGSVPTGPAPVEPAPAPAPAPVPVSAPVSAPAPVVAPSSPVAAPSPVVAPVAAAPAPAKAKTRTTVRKALAAPRVVASKGRVRVSGRAAPGTRISVRFVAKGSSRVLRTLRATARHDGRYEGAVRRSALPRRGWRVRAVSV
jgi:hypothetical protein